MIFKQRNSKSFFLALFAVLPLQACAQNPSIDQDAKEIEKTICRLSDVDEISRRLSDMGIESYLSEKEKQLNAIKQQEERKGLVSSAVAITVQYDPNRKVTSCSVRVVHTGP